MGTEIERKFLVLGDDWRAGASPTSYIQGYLSRDLERMVRVRQAGPSAYLTIKGPRRVQADRSLSIPFLFPMLSN